MANIETIGVRAVAENVDKTISDLNRLNKAVGSVGSQATATASPLGVLGGALANVATIAAGIISAQLINRMVEGLKDLASQAIMGAARVDELEVILELLGTRAGYSTSQLYQWRDAVEDAGIRTDVATELLAQFIRYQIDAGDAVKLAAVAQNAATFAAEDSTTALAGLLHGILTQNTLVLRNYNILVDTNKAMEDYKVQIGAVGRDLTSTERVQAELNAVLAQGSSIAGAYAAAMETPSKMLRTLSGRLIPEMIWAMGEPFQRAFHDAVFAISDFVTNLRIAVSEGGRLRPILDALASAANRLLAPIVALSSVVGKWLGATAQGAAESAKAVGELGETIAAIPALDLSATFADEAKKITDINRDLTKSLARMWDDYSRRLAQTVFDFNLGRLRDELDWQRQQQRDLAEHNRKMAEMYAELDDLRTGKRRREIQAGMKAERKTYQEQRAKLVVLLGQAQSEEEKLRVQGWIDALDAEHKANKDAAQEELDAVNAEQAALEKRIATEERAFRDRQDMEAEDRRIRMEREDEDFARRLSRDEEETRLREEQQRQEAAERIALVQEGIAAERAAKAAAYAEQTAALTTSVEQQKGLLTELATKQKSLVDEWKARFEELIPILQEDLIPALQNLWAAWGVFYKEIWPIVKPILQFLADQILPVLTNEADKLTKQLIWQAGIVFLVKREWELFQARMILVGTALGILLAKAWEVASKFYEVGAGIVRGIIDGINGWWQALIDRVRGLAEAIWYEFKIRMGIGSPSKIFFGMGQDLVRGLAEGIRSMGTLPALQMGNVALGTLAAVPASTSNVSNTYNLNMSSLASVSTVAADFHLMKVLAGPR